jgi:hypothetical protein
LRQAICGYIQPGQSIPGLPARPIDRRAVSACGTTTFAGSGEAGGVAPSALSLLDPADDIEDTNLAAAELGL